MAPAAQSDPRGAYPKGAAVGFSLAWVLFWGLEFATCLQQYAREGHNDFWQPVLWQGASLIISTLLAIACFRYAYVMDGLLTRPWRWFGCVLLALPLLAVFYVASLTGLRRAVYALIGQPCDHAFWSGFQAEALDFATFFLLFAGILFGMRSFVAMSEARVAAERERGLAQHAQLLQLTQQIQPHFLFNTLNTIAEAIVSNPVLAESLLLGLSRLLRAATDLSQRPQSRLDEEIRLLEAYASIMQQRFADRARVHFEVDAAAHACVVPTLLLQPLLENAFRHGVEQRTGPCAVVVSARQRGARLELEVNDDAGTLHGVPVYGVGLSNLQQRLATLYGGQAELSVMPRAGRGVVARIELPCESWS